MMKPQNTYQKTTNGIKCISKCYNAKEIIAHPISTEPMTNVNEPFCAIVPTIVDDKLVPMDKCEPKYNSSMHDDTYDVLYPIIEISPNDFLMKFYNVSNVDDFYALLRNNENYPVFTKIRMLDCFINIYITNVNVIDTSISTLVHGIIDDFWINKIYDAMHQYVFIFNNICTLVHPENNKLDREDFAEQRIKYLSEQITPQLVYEFVNNYVHSISEKQITDDWAKHSVIYHQSTDGLLKFIIVSLENRFDSITKKNI